MESWLRILAIGLGALAAAKPATLTEEPSASREGVDLPLLNCPSGRRLAEALPSFGSSVVERGLGSGDLKQLWQLMPSPCSPAFVRPIQPITGTCARNAPSHCFTGSFSDFLHTGGSFPTKGTVA